MNDGFHLYSWFVIWASSVVSTGFFPLRNKAGVKLFIYFIFFCILDPVIDSRTDWNLPFRCQHWRVENILIYLCMAVCSILFLGKSIQNLCRKVVLTLGNFDLLASFECIFLKHFPLHETSGIRRETFTSHKSICWAGQSNLSIIYDLVKLVSKSGSLLVETVSYTWFHFCWNSWIFYVLHTLLKLTDDFWR